MTPAQIKVECECLFQAGGPRVYTFDPETARLQAEWGSGAAAVRLAPVGHQVWARRKVLRERHWEWKFIGTGT